MKSRMSNISLHEFLNVNIILFESQWDIAEDIFPLYVNHERLIDDDINNNRGVYRDKKDKQRNALMGLLRHAFAYFLPIKIN
jgi:hypothetical protein